LVSTAANSEALPNQMADQLRALIVRGTLLPGEHLGQTQLATRFGHSKVPIREALKLLTAEGFLRHDRHRGYFVAPLELEEARQLYKLRRWLEAELLSTAEWPPEEQIRQFYAEFDGVDAIDQARDFTNWAIALEGLRLKLFDLSPQKILLREATRLWRLTDRYRALMPRTMAESPERRLIDALAARDRGALIADYMEARSKVEMALEQAFANR
jgi:DNA-binding GntR family transcriptional regulator